MAQEIDVRNKDDLEKAVATADMILEKSYLNILNSKDVPIVRQMKDVAKNPEFINELNDSVRFFDVTQVVLNKNENVRDKLVSVYNAVGSAGASLLMMVHGEENRVSVKFGIKANHNAGDYASVLENCLKGNFPGSKIEPVRKDRLQADILSAFPSSCSVASVTDVSGNRSEEENRERQFMQGIEKLIDTMQGKRYTMLLIADPVSLVDLGKSRRALENLYSSLVPFSESQMTVGASETESVSSSISHGVTETVNKSITETVSHTSGTSTSTTDSTTNGVSAGINIGSFSSSGTTGSVSAGLFGIGGSIASTVMSGLSSGLNVGVNHSKTHSFTEGQSQSDTHGKAEQVGSSYGSSETSTKGESHGTGMNRSLQIKFENHAVKQIMARIDKTLERYDNCADVGMWNCAMYCIAENPHDAQMAANVYHSIIRGKNSSLENGGVTVWGMDKSRLIANSLKYMCHPYFHIDSLDITLGTLISSAELAIHAGLPNHSVPGLPVLECAEFGRTVSTYDEDENSEDKSYSVELGRIWHMNQEEELAVVLNPDSLASHTFITGSTGSGKSNTVYQMLSEIRKFATFLVVEPAKGEYKNVFGGNVGVSVYGTNPTLTNLLRINPFSFPHGDADASKNIHVLEHLDRLIEIFNVCWPMYAAMPAVLKEAMEKSYEDCGWNLAESTNEYEERYGEALYPTFGDVTRNIRAIIDSSEYDTENKGAYKGSLITRLKSLTNGINGLIFAAHEISSPDLFDRNVIVDLSRIGSAETKSLIMGLLVMKLQEYRMTNCVMNSPLRHVTVLEEAHNLLKRTATEQSQDSGNLLGKSVEMLTNSIAEMRTYGEGFVIADQAPALLDMAVIRNTNTKIIMRLPDQDDRELVGKAANLNDDQITELAKLPRGVAAVYQNEWVEAVLCKVNHCTPKGNWKPTKDLSAPVAVSMDDSLEVARLLCEGVSVKEETKLKELSSDLKRIKMNASTQVKILKFLANPPVSPRFTKLAPVMAELFPSAREAFVASYEATSDTIQWTEDVDRAVREAVGETENEELLRNIRQCIITDYLHNELGKTEQLERWSKEGGLK